MKIKKALIILATILFLNSCMDEFKITKPNKIEKLATIKAINKIGETELIRKVKLEKFEISNVVLTKEMIDTIDSRIEFKRQDMIESIKHSIEFEKDRRDSNMERAIESENQAKRNPSMKNYHLDTANDYWRYVKKNDQKINKYEAELKSYENGTDENPLIEYYRNVKKIHLEYGDTTAKVFDVVYLIDDARTTTKFSFLGKDDSTAYNHEITKKFLMSEVSKNWEIAWKKAFNR